MDLKASRKRQLAAAVTLAVMGMAWVSVPQQVWADSAQIGSETAPVTWEYYNTDPKVKSVITETINQALMFLQRSIIKILMTIPGLLLAIWVVKRLLSAV